jgi:hypothetical protein
LTIVAVVGKDLFLANVGHSKAFVFRSGRLIQLIATHGREAQRSAALPYQAIWGTNGLTDGISEDEIADALALRRSPDED